MVPSSKDSWATQCSRQSSACDCRIFFKRQVTNFADNKRDCRPRSNPSSTISRFNLNVMGGDTSARAWTPEGKVYDCQLIIKSPGKIKGSLPPMWPILQDNAYSHLFLNQSCLPCNNKDNLIKLKDLKERCLSISNKIIADQVWYLHNYNPKKKPCMYGKSGPLPCKINSVANEIDHNISDICKRAGRKLQPVKKKILKKEIKAKHMDQLNMKNIKSKMNDVNGTKLAVQQMQKENNKRNKNSKNLEMNNGDKGVKKKKLGEGKVTKYSANHPRESGVSKKDYRKKSVLSRLSTDMSLFTSKIKSSKMEYGSGKPEKSCAVYRHSVDFNRPKATADCREEQIKVISFETEPSFLEMYCFRKRSQPERYNYPDGTTAVCLDTDGSGKIFYSGGQLAIALTSTKLGYRMIIMSDPCFNEIGEYECSIPVAVFDSKGNGVVYDTKGNKRLNFDQAEGILYDTRSGAPMRWQWKLYKWVVQRRKELQVLRETPYETLSDKDVKDVHSRSIESVRRSSESVDPSPGLVHSTFWGGVSSISFNPHSRASNPQVPAETVKPKTRTKEGSTEHRENIITHGSPFREVHYPDFSSLHLPNAGAPDNPVPIEPRPIAMKITNSVSLHILHQEHIHIDFRSYPVHLHLNIGVRLKMDSVAGVDKMSTCTPGLSPVPCFVDLYFKRTQSLKNIHDEIKLLQDHTLEERKQRNIKKAKEMGFPEKYIPSRESLASYVEYI